MKRVAPNVKKQFYKDYKLWLGVFSDCLTLLLVEGGGDTCKQRGPGYTNLLKYICDYCKKSLGDLPVRLGNK